MTELALSRRLLDRLDEAGIAFCHWKSNEHLAAGLAGETDLDLLVDHEQRGNSEKILTDLGFKRFVAPSFARHDGIEDHLGMDPETGRLIHLHWHYELSVGRRGSKDYRLPWERRILETRLVDEEHGCPVATPEAEYLLLLVRAHLKDAWNGSAADAALGEEMAREVVWLRRKLDPERLERVAADLLGAGAARLVIAILEEGPSRGRVAELCRNARPLLETFARRGPAGRFFTRWRRSVARQGARVRARLLQQPVPRRRTNPRGGVVLAVLGSDGSGKSTAVANLSRWLSWKIDVFPMYMGVPRALTSLLRKVVRAVPAVAPGDERSSASEPRTEAKPGLLRPMLRAAWALAIALDKRLKLRRAARARHLGLVVICDRYPQTHTMNFNDGPLMSAWRDHPNFLVRRLARSEFAAYESRTIPDLVLKLNVSPEVCCARRPGEMTLEAARRKAGSIRELAFPAGTKVVEIDADLPLAEVLLKARRAVWDVV
ncbi:MAG: hypothetical protein V2A76_16740 [Planctomycetota bacterium]